MSEPILVMVSNVCGHIAMWATRQSPYHAPDFLTDVLREFQISAINDKCHETHYGCFWFNLDKESPASHLSKILKEHLLCDPKVRAWNNRKNGNQSPFGFVSRYDKPSPDNDFIDLDALVRNIARSCIEEFRREREIDRRQFKTSPLSRLKNWLRYKLTKPQTPLCPP